VSRLEWDNRNLEVLEVGVELHGESETDESVGVMVYTHRSDQVLGIQGTTLRTTFIFGGRVGAG
jgi:hypothetical protein